MKLTARSRAWVSGEEASQSVLDFRVNLFENRRGHDEVSVMILRDGQEIPRRERGSVASYLYIGDGLKPIENEDGALTTLLWDGQDYLGEY